MPGLSARLYKSLTTPTRIPYGKGLVIEVVGFFPPTEGFGHA
jgi:hypothetical protein